MKKRKVKVTVYIPNPLHEKFMKEVLRRVTERRQFRGVKTEIVVEALRAYLV